MPFRVGLSIYLELFQFLASDAEALKAPTSGYSIDLKTISIQLCQHHRFRVRA